MKLIICFLLSFNLFANEEEKSLSTEVKERLEKLLTLSPEDYLKSIDDYRETLSKYIEFKKLVCRGEFSAVVLNEKKLDTIDSEVGEEERKQKRLTLEEKKACFRELKSTQLTYINNMFKARTSYLSFIHKKRIEELNAVRKKSVEDIQIAFAREEKTLTKKPKRKKRRRRPSKKKKN